MTFNQSHLGMCMVTRGQFITIKISPGGSLEGKGKGTKSSCFPAPLFWRRLWERGNDGEERGNLFQLPMIHKGQTPVHACTVRLHGAAASDAAAAVTDRFILHGFGSIHATVVVAHQCEIIIIRFRGLCGRIHRLKACRSYALGLFRRTLFITYACSIEFAASRLEYRID